MDLPSASLTPQQRGKHYVSMLLRSSLKDFPNIQNESAVFSLKPSYFFV
jgi:hypothetical protein